MRLGESLWTAEVVVLRLMSWPVNQTVCKPASSRSSAWIFLAFSPEEWRWSRVQGIGMLVKGQCNRARALQSMPTRVSVSSELFDRAFKHAHDCCTDSCRTLLHPPSLCSFCPDSDHTGTRSKDNLKVFVLFTQRTRTETVVMWKLSYRPFSQIKTRRLTAAVS